ELDAGNLADFREAGVFAQETIAGVDGVDVGDLGGGDYRGNIQIALGALGRPDADSLIGETDVQALAIGLRIYGHSANAQLFAGADDPKSYLAAVGNQDLLKRGGCQTGPLRTPPAAHWIPACSSPLPLPPLQ